MSISQLTQELLDLINNNENGVVDSDIQAHFRERYSALPNVINTLLSQNRLKLYTLNGSLMYKAVNELTAAKFEGLGYCFCNFCNLKDLGLSKC